MADPTPATLRGDAEAIWRSAVASSMPDRALRAHLSYDPVRSRLTLGAKSYRLNDCKRIIVVGAGKGAGALAAAFEAFAREQLPRTITLTGLVLVPSQALAQSYQTERIKLCSGATAGRNLPTAEALAGTAELVALLASAESTDLVVGLFTGGGSALLVRPVAGVDLADAVAVTRLLMAKGAPIGELNTVRKHLSQVKGGRLLGYGKPHAMVNFYLSDVIGDDLATVASGPTVPDDSTFKDCLTILERFDSAASCPKAVLDYLKAGAVGRHPETLKALPTERVDNVLIGSNLIGLTQAAQTAKRLGYHPELWGEPFAGEARSWGEILFARLQRAATGQTPVAWLAGGETTVTLQNSPGKGGRNQEVALGFLLQALEAPPASLPPFALLAAGSDGEDGPTDAAGAFVDNNLLREAESHAEQAKAALSRHDAYPFWDGLGALFKPGLTGTNIADLVVLLVGRK